MKKHQNAASTSTSSITSAVLIPTLSFSSPITTTPNSRASKFKDELLAHKRQTLEMLNKHSQSIKKGKKTLQKVHSRNHKAFLLRINSVKSIHFFFRKFSVKLTFY